MLKQELPPGGPGSKRRRWQAMTAEDAADGLVRAAHAELEQLTLDPPVNPSGCSPLGQAQAKLAMLGDLTRTSVLGRRANSDPLRR